MFYFIDVRRILTATAILFPVVMTVAYAFI